MPTYHKEFSRFNSAHTKDGQLYDGWAIYKSHDFGGPDLLIAVVETEAMADALIELCQETSYFASQSDE